MDSKTISGMQPLHWGYNRSFLGRGMFRLTHAALALEHCEDSLRMSGPSFNGNGKWKSWANVNQPHNHTMKGRSWLEGEFSPGWSFSAYMRRYGWSLQPESVELQWWPINLEDPSIQTNWHHLPVISGFATGQYFSLARTPSSPGCWHTFFGRRTFQLSTSAAQKGASKEAL